MASRYRVSTIVTTQRMGEAVDALTALNFETKITRVFDTAAPALKWGDQVSTRPAPYVMGSGIKTKVGKPKRTYVRGGGKTSETGRGKLVISYLANHRMARYTDLFKVLTDAGYAAGGNLLKDLEKEGRVIREGRGVYRLPSTTETLQHQQGQDPSFQR